MGQAQINVRTRACSRTSIARTRQAALTHNVRGKELMKFGIHVIWEPTAPNQKMLGQSDQWCGRYCPPNFENSGKNWHGCQPLNPHISGMSDPIFIKLVLMDRQFHKDSKYVMWWDWSNFQEKSIT